MRSVQQKEAGKELARLEKIWYEQCAKNVAIDADIQRMQLEIASLEAEQGEKTTDGEKATDGEKGRKRKAEAEAPKEDEAPAEKEPRKRTARASKGSK